MYVEIVVFLPRWKLREVCRSKKLSRRWTQTDDMEWYNSCFSVCLTEINTWLCVIRGCFRDSHSTALLCLQSLHWSALTGACWKTTPPFLEAAGGESEPPLVPARPHFRTTLWCQTVMIHWALEVVIQLWRVLAMMKMTKERCLMILTQTHLLRGRAAAWIVTRRTSTPLDPVANYSLVYICKFSKVWI